MLKLKFNVKLAVILGMLLFFSACQESINDITPSEKDVRQVVLQKNGAKDKMVDAMAQNLASNLSSKEVRSFIKQKTIEQFDGDYNFLIETSKNTPVSVNANGRAINLTFKEILSGKISNPSGRVESTDFIDSLTALYPLLQVALPELETGDAVTWDVEANPPLVAFVPSDYNESNLNAVIPAYDSEGNYHELNANEEPDRLVIVISDNERLIAVEKPQSSSNGRAETSPTVSAITINGCLISMAPYYASETHLFYFKNDVYPIIDACGGGGSGGGGSGGGGSGGGGSGGGGSSTCDRERKNTRDNLLKARFCSRSAIREVELWAWGRPEMYVIISTAKNPYGNPVFGMQRKWIGNEGWYHRQGLLRRLVIDTKTINIPIVTWDDDTYGDSMVYTWIEEDRAKFRIDFDVTVTSTFNVLNRQVANVTVSGNGTISILGRDDVSGDATVEYCSNTDGNGTRHVGGGVEFWVNQE